MRRSMRKRTRTAGWQDADQLTNFVVKALKRGGSTPLSSIQFNKLIKGHIMKKDDAIKAMRDRVREGKQRKNRMWLDELERSVDRPAKKLELDESGDVLWDPY